MTRPASAPRRRPHFLLVAVLSVVAVASYTVLASQPAARVGDKHSCPMITPPSTPHTGGPVVAGASTVLIGGKPAARVTDTCTCNGPPAKISTGSSSVLIEGLAAARIGDSTSHGGVLVEGCATVLIGP